MNYKVARQFGSALIALIAVFCLLSETRSQQRRRPSRRTTNPVPARSVGPAPTPAPAEPTVVSTAEDAAAQDDDSTPRRRTTRNTRRAAEQEATEQETLRNTVNRLTETVTQLSSDLTELKGEQRVLVDLERLNRAEQRAEGLRAQLRDVTDKEFVIQDRLAQLEDELQPGAIERRSALIGTLNPSAVREQIRLSLEREKERLQRQLEMLNTSHVRLESAIASADQEVERIKRRLDDMERKQLEADSNANAGQTTTTQPATPPPSTNPPAEPPKE